MAALVGGWPRYGGGPDCALCATAPRTELGAARARSGVHQLELVVFGQVHLVVQVVVAAEAVEVAACGRGTVNTSPQHPFGPQRRPRRPQ